jgi:hypothetical protein
LEFLKASIADLITLLFSSLQNSEGSGDGDSGDSCDSCADPCQFFTISEDQNLTFSLSPSLLRPLAKHCNEAATIFTKICQ